MTLRCNKMDRILDVAWCSVFAAILRRSLMHRAGQLDCVSHAAQFALRRFLLWFHGKNRLRQTALFENLVQSRSPGAQGWLKWKRLCPLRLQPKTWHSASLDSRHRHHAPQRSHTWKYSHSTSCADSHRALVCEGWRHGGVVFGCLDHWWPMCFMIVRNRSPKVIILHMSDLNCNGALLHICSHIAFVACWRLKASFLLGKSMFDTSVTLSPNMSNKIQPPLIYLIIFTLSPYYDESHGLMFSCTSFFGRDTFDNSETCAVAQ